MQRHAHGTTINGARLVRLRARVTCTACRRAIVSHSGRPTAGWRTLQTVHGEDAEGRPKTARVRTYRCQFCGPPPAR